MFAPPYLPARSERLRYTTRKPAQPVTYAQFPEPIIRQPPAALPPPTRPLELPLPAPPAEPARVEPGTWRDIIARLDVGEAAAPPETSPDTTPDDDAVVHAQETGPVDHEDTAPSAAQPSTALTDSVAEEPEEIGAPGEAVPWEIEAFTTPDYAAARTEEVAEIGDLVLDQVVAHEARPDEPEPAAGAARSDFPLNAFIVPPGTRHAPAGYEADVALRVAGRLEELARLLRSDGLAALGTVDSADELSRVIAAIVTGYVTREE